MVLLARNKLNSVEKIKSKPLIDSKINIEKFTGAFNVKQNYIGLTEASDQKLIN